MNRFNDCMYRDICKYEDLCKTSCKRYVLTTSLLEYSNIPTDKRTANNLIPSPEDEKTFKRLEDIKFNIDYFVEDGRILYLWSKNCGNGKTSWSIKMMLQYFNYVWEDSHFDEPMGVFINVPEFIRKYKQFNNPVCAKYVNELTDTMEKSKLVVFDDLGSNNISNYDFEVIFGLISECILHHKGIIITSNVDQKTLYKLMGERVSDRLCSDYYYELKGRSHRGE